MEEKTTVAATIDDLLCLPRFAAFLLEEKLDDYIEKQLEIAEELNVPLLRLFKKLPADERQAVTKNSVTKLLQLLAGNRAAEQIHQALDQWKTNRLPVVDRDDVVAEDITSVNHVRQRALLHFVPAYTTDPQTIIALANEINLFVIESISRSTALYLGLQKKQLAENALFIQKVAETVPGAIYVFDVESYQGIYSNNKLPDVIGYPQEELNTLGPAAIPLLVHPEDQNRLKTGLTDVHTDVDNNRPLNTKYRIRKKDGSYKWLANYESVFRRKEDGSVWQTIGITLDIDEEQKALEEHKTLLQKLAEADARHRQAEALAHIGTYAWHIATDTLEWSDEMYRIYETGKDERIGQDFIYSRMHPDDHKTVRDVIGNSIATGQPFDFYYRILTPSGKEKIPHSRGRIEKDSAGGSERIVGTDQDVTEKQNLIRRLQKTEALYKQAEEIADMGNWSWDVDTERLEWTDQLYRIYGLEPQSEPITNERFLSFVHPADREFVARGVEKLNTEATLDYTFRIIAADGTEKWLRSIARPVRNHNGDLLSVVGTEQNVSEKEGLIHRLRESQTFIRKITDATPSIIASYNVNSGKYTFISEGLQKLLGYPPSVVMEKGVAFFHEIIHPDDVAPLTEKNARALQEADANPDKKDLVMEFKYRLKHADGGYRWFHTYGTAFDFNVEGKVEHILNITLDVTEQREAIETIQEQEQFIQQIADASPTILYVFDVPSQRMAYINREAFFVLGYLPDEIMETGEGITAQLYHPEDLPLLPARHGSGKAFQQADSMIQYECRMRHKDGSYRWLLVREVMFKPSGGGQPTQIIGAALDISRRKDMERTILQNTRQLEQSNASLEEFVYVASHDLKEPLRKISTFGDRLAASHTDKLGEDGGIYLKKIVDASQRMQNMISDLLSVSLISGNRQFEKTSLQKIWEETLQTLEFKIEQQKAVIRYNALPEAHVVPSQFCQLFQNLLSNSLKFVRDGVQPIVTVDCSTVGAEGVGKYELRKANAYIKIRFADNGIGFENEYAQKIFAIFHRLHGRSEYEGPGIGLAICRKIVEHHSGLIFAEGSPGLGAAFTLIIPA